MPDEPKVTEGDNFIMYDVRRPTNDAQTASAKTASAQPQPSKRIPCPHCHTMNVASSLFCENCGQKMSVPKANPQPQAAPRPSQISCPYCHQLNSADSVFCLSCGKKLVRTQSAPQSQTVTKSAPQASSAQVRYADESMKKWEMHPGESVEHGKHEIIMLQPSGGKYAYYMEVTNERILLSREGAAAKNAALVARRGVGGLVGSLIAEGVMAAAGTGLRPWLEIPLAAVSSCGVQNRNEFYIVADQTYVLKNKSYDKFLPDMVAKAKNRGA